ncbi:MAG: Nif3-like dinuclear metal center hexameric protein [Deltaproteobacteria bacterium]|nr:Nif3-like dinuclear metal center hexameric protein [Deltaproteobacteria bacterium]
MTPLLKDILNMLDEIAPFSGAEEWDNPGLQVGFVSDVIKKVFISLDPSIEALRKAGETGAQLLLTHHPLIFSGIKRIDPDIYPGDVIAEALTSRISIVAAHTNLDAAKDGINDILASMIGLQNTEALIEKNGSGKSLDGMGRVGNLSVPMTLTAIARNIMDVIGSTGLMVLGDPDREIKRVAVLGGSGGSELSHASGKGADLYVTGDVRHHEALTARSLGLALIDAGHFNMERAAMLAFADFLRDKFNERGWDIIVEIFKDESAPMTYVGRKA